MAEPSERALEEIANSKRLPSEKAYREIHDPRSPRGCYADLKDYFADAVGAAERTGLSAEAKRLRDRLDHCRAVYRDQFAGFER